MMELQMGSIYADNKESGHHKQQQQQKTQECNLWVKYTFISEFKRQDRAMENENSGSQMLNQRPEPELGFMQRRMSLKIKPTFLSLYQNLQEWGQGNCALRTMKIAMNSTKSWHWILTVTRHCTKYFTGIISQNSQVNRKLWTSFTIIIPVT